MTVKVLISGEAGAGKTSLIKDLPNSLLISHDGKRPNVRIPNVYIPSFNSIAELINTINEKIEAYNDKIGSYPDTIIFDSVSRIYDTINNYCNDKYTGLTLRPLVL